MSLHEYKHLVFIHLRGYYFVSIRLFGLMEKHLARAFHEGKSPRLVAEALIENAIVTRTPTQESNR